MISSHALKTLFFVLLILAVGASNAAADADPLDAILEHNAGGSDMGSDAVAEDLRFLRGTPKAREAHRELGCGRDGDYCWFDSECCAGSTCKWEALLGGWCS